MLTLLSGLGSPDCSGASRRDFLRAGALGLAGLTLPGLLAARAAASNDSSPDFIRDRSVVLLYLSGGASQIETFNPNMGAPTPYRSLTGEVRTSVPGVTFGGSFPLLASHAHRMAVVRNFRHPVGDHDQAHVHVLSGGTDPAGTGDAPDAFSLGALAARLRGPSHPRTGLPTFAMVTQDEVDDQYQREQGRFLRGNAPASLGPAYAGMRSTVGDEPRRDKQRPGRSDSRGADGNSLADDLTLAVPAERLADRRSLLAALDRLRRDVDAGGQIAAADKYRQQTYDLIAGGGAADALDLSREDPRLLERYDTIGMKVGFLTVGPSSLGRQMLLARRLCEAGCGFVTVHSAGWDMHADARNPGIVDGMKMLGPTLDKSVSAFLEDVAARGLSEKILLVITGDFGRTPKVNSQGGRDHWSGLCPLAFAGGGLKMGQVIGRSDRRNAEPDGEPVTPQMMMATIVHTLFDVGKLRVVRSVPSRVLAMIEAARPIRELC